MSWKKQILNNGTNTTVDLKDSDLNGYIVVNGSEINVYDDTTIKTYIDTKIQEESTNILTSISNTGILVASESEFTGNADTNKTFDSSKNGFSITNDGIPGVDPDLTFTINGLTFSVKAGESFESAFNTFTDVTINTTVSFRAHPLTYVNMGV